MGYPALVAGVAKTTAGHGWPFDLFPIRIKSS
jgi:hypothetical protein